jgi:putative hydrolase of HD superfamily
MTLEPKNFWDYVFELGQLRNVRHEGWRLAGVEQPEMVAAHSLRAAQIAYILAVLEGHPSPTEVCTITVFHDIEETRVGDVHRVASRYISMNKGEAVREQTKPLGDLGQQIFDLWAQQEQRSTQAGIIAKDADMLDMMAMAKEYQEQGYASTQDWLTNLRQALKTESAQQLADALAEQTSTDWWQGLKKLA